MYGPPPTHARYLKYIVFNNLIFSQYPFEIDVITIPILRMKKL